MLGYIISTWDRKHRSEYTGKDMEALFGHIGLAILYLNAIPMEIGAIVVDKVWITLLWACSNLSAMNLIRPVAPAIKRGVIDVFFNLPYRNALSTHGGSMHSLEISRSKVTSDATEWSLYCKNCAGLCNTAQEKILTPCRAHHKIHWSPACSAWHSKSALYWNT